MGIPPVLLKLQAELRLIDQNIHDLLSRSEFRNRKVIGLNLNNIDLSSFTHFPITISQFTDLQSLSLRNTNLVSIPDLVLELSSLRYLDISHNHLRKLPVMLTKLKNLEKLNASNNLIKTINDLPSTLESLDLSNNSLDHIPLQIKKLHVLKKLILAENHIRSVNNYILTLRNIEYLNLRSNYIRSVPDEFFNIPTLKKLNLYNNPISMGILPKDRWDLTVFVDRRVQIPAPNIRILQPQIFDVRLSPKHPPTFQLTSAMFFGLENSGKHTLIRKYIDSFYTPKQSLSVQQNRYLSWDHYILENQHRLYQFWYPNNQDLRDQNYTQGILNGFYYTSMVCLVFDLSKPESYRFILDAIKRIIEIRHEPCPIFVIGNQFEGTKPFAEKQWFESIIESLKDNIEAYYVEVSAKTGRNVNKLFEEIFATDV